MDTQAVLHHLARLVFVGALLAFLLAALELVGQFANFSLIRGYYTPGRLVELAAALLTLVIAIRLGEICDQMRSKH